jgi:hypothetical protein
MVGGNERFITFVRTSSMTLTIARMVIRDSLNRMARLDPEAARELERAIHILVDDAVTREVRRIGIDILGESELGRPRGGADPDEGA